MRTVLRPRPARATAVAVGVVAIVAILAGVAAVNAGGAGSRGETSSAGGGASLAAADPSSGPASSAPPAWSSDAWPADSPGPSLQALPSALPTPAYAGPLVATRVVVPDLGIDLAITKSPAAGVYPYCNVAMFFGKPFGQPGQNVATYLFAHARLGMFYPIYRLTMIKRTPNKMVGMLVDVYTSDSRLHVYRITRVLPHQLTLNRAAAVRQDELWLQTSEGPHGTPGKTQVVADPVSTSTAGYDASHPKAHIVRCGA